MGSIDVNLTINVSLIIYLATYLFVNGFLIYLLFRLGKTLREISISSKNIRNISGLNELDELKQSLFDIQNTTARQLSEINKLKQALSGNPTAAGASPGPGSLGMRIARSGMT
jgi:hypothetical protein